MASSQFPDEMTKIREVLVSLVIDGKIVEMQGEQLYAFLREIGLPVRMNTTIKVTGHGKTESLSAKLRESTK
ncbi:TPA: iron-containing alcohol dehydrogenase family protein [Candidatus Bathyarchaeota archaeon]|nr:iron-containing alcohol dehydrogenase family protein [Candidatus Bathyarchaeota archaeon]